MVLYFLFGKGILHMWLPCGARILFAAHNILIPVFFPENSADVWSLQMDEDTPLKAENALVAGEAVDSWLSTVRSYESGTNYSQNQVVYSVDGNGNQIPIAIIIDGSFQTQEENMEMSFPCESEEIIDEHSKWIGGQEECTTNESYAQSHSTGDLMTVEVPKEDIKIETHDVIDEDLI